MARPGGGSDGIDTTRPNMARVYDYLLGGTCNFAADREMAGTMMDPGGGCPELPRLAKDNRSFLTRAVGWLSALGSRQFIDAGCGLPARPPVHETAREYDPSASVAYVDNDTGVLCYTRAALDGREGLAVIDGDLTDPAAILADKGLREIIDLRKPVVVLLAAVLHFLAAAAAAEVVAGWMDPLPAGSAAVISVVSYADPELAARMAARYTAGHLHHHGEAEVASFFGAAGLDLVPGQVVQVRAWPMAPSGVKRDAVVLGGVGLKLRGPGPARASAGAARGAGRGNGGARAVPDRA